MAQRGTPDRKVVSSNPDVVFLLQLGLTKCIPYILEIRIFFWGTQIGDAVGVLPRKQEMVGSNPEGARQPRQSEFHGTSTSTALAPPTR